MLNPDLEFDTYSEEPVEPLADEYEDESDSPTQIPDPNEPRPWHHPIAGMPPWEQWPNESAQAFAAFCLYRDLGPNRSLVNAYRLRLGYEKATISGTWSKWRGKFHWKDRAKAFDQDKVAQLREAERQVELQMLGLRLKRQTVVHEAYAGLADQILRRVVETLPGLTLVDEVTHRADGGKIVRRGNSPANLARLLQQLRELESCVAHGFPNPSRLGW